MSAAKPLRIVHSEAATSMGGQENRIFKEMVAMREQGHHLEAICQPDAQLTPRLREAGFTVHAIPMDGVYNLIKGAWQVSRILKRSQIDVLNTHSRRDTLVAGLGARLAGTPLIVRTRHLSNRVGSLLSYTWIPHRVTTVSQYVRKHLIDRGVPAEHIKTIYSPIVVPERVASSTLRDELGLSQSDVVVGCVAVMRATKGHRLLVDAMQILMQDRPNLHLVLIGSGSPVYEQIQAHIRQIGLSSRIHMLGTRRDVPNLLSGCDLFALPTQQEASGTVFVEAAACGLPVVATDVGGVSEMMRPGETGFLVPAQDADALRLALAKLIDDPDLRVKMGVAGYDMVWKEGVFTTRTLARETESAYRAWLAAKSLDQ